MEVYFVRHSRPDIEQGQCYGHLDVDVAESFLTDIENLRNKFSKISVDKCFSSPSRRCLKLAKEIFGETILTDHRWMELNFGHWEGKEWSTLAEDEVTYWMNNYVEAACPGGESYNELYRRAISAFEDLTKKGEFTTVVVTHAGTIRSIIAYLLQVPLEKSFVLQLDYAGVTKVKYEQGIFTIEYINRLS